jgi:hypothetical protein
MINSQNLINKVCCAISGGGLSSLQTCQANGALNFLAASPVTSVANVASLPSALTNDGRMIYVDNENKYYYAFDGIWSNNFDSTRELYKTVPYAWGCNDVGQVGRNSAAFPGCTSVQTVCGSLYFKNVSGGSNFTGGVTLQGTAWTWGGKAAGNIGDGTSSNRSSPVSVVGGFTDWCCISLGDSRATGLRSNGTIWTWGAGSGGGLGDNTATSKSSPVSVVGNISDWTVISGKGSGTRAIRSNGSMVN